MAAISSRPGKGTRRSIMFVFMDVILPLETWVSDYTGRISDASFVKLLGLVRAFQTFQRDSRRDRSLINPERVCELLLQCAEDIVSLFPLVEPLHADRAHTLKAKLDRSGWSQFSCNVVSMITDVATDMLNGGGLCCHDSNKSLIDVAVYCLQEFMFMCERKPSGIRDDIQRLEAIEFPVVSLTRRAVHSRCTTAVQTLRRCLDLATRPFGPHPCTQDLLKVLPAVWEVFCEGTSGLRWHLERIVFSRDPTTARGKGSSAPKAEFSQLAEDVDTCKAWHRVLECAIYDDDEIYLEKGREFARWMAVAIQRYMMVMLDTDLRLGCVV